MKRFLFFVCFIFIYSAFSQSIRKNHREMTPTERSELIQAFVDLRYQEVLQLANFHAINFSAIHFNLPQAPQDDVFFAWHRRQMFEMEQAMQDINPNITIPYWDWVTERTVNRTDPLGIWNYNFMGYFEAAGTIDWGLGRQFDDEAVLPLQFDIDNVQNLYNNNPTNIRNRFRLYSNAVERGPVHTAGHLWVGGTAGDNTIGKMADINSPADPVFYLHHTMIDKLWQDWVVTNNANSSSNLFVKNPLPRYDNINDPGKPDEPVNPKDIIDSKVLGVFYAENGLARLYDYTVSNTYHFDMLPQDKEEVFYYQYTIEADNFIIPSGKKARVESVNEVILKDGFHAQSGSTFVAKIDTDNNINTSAKTANIKPLKRSEPISNFRIGDAYLYQHGVYREAGYVSYSLKNDIVGLDFKKECTPCELELVDSKNILILNKTVNPDEKIEFDLKQLAPGTHYLRIRSNNELIVDKEFMRF